MRAGSYSSWDGLPAGESPPFTATPHVIAPTGSPTSWNKEDIPLSVSVGLGEYDADTNPEDITSKSDEALYRAKQAGKNTVRVFKPNEQ